MRTLAGLLAVAAVLTAALLGTWWMLRITLPFSEEEFPRSIASVPRAGGRLSPRPVRPHGQRVIAPSPAAHVTCAGCERTPTVAVAVETKPKESPASSRVTQAAARVTATYHYAPEAYAVLGGRSAYPHELVEDILERQELGHLTFTVGIPNVAYRIQGVEETPGTYEVGMGDVALVDDAVVSVNFSIRYPLLSNGQFVFVRDLTDYRYVYGLIDGIVRHEERHFRVLQTYVNDLVKVLTSPLTGDLRVAADTSAEFQRKANALVSQTLADRLGAVRVSHENAQDAIDDPSKKARIEFVFEEEVNGSVPPPLIAEFVGEGNFSFALPPGPAPKPPAPKISY